MPEGDLMVSLMRLNSPGQFLASGGYFGCQDMTTKADQTPRTEPWRLSRLGRKGAQKLPRSLLALHPFPGTVH